MAAALSLFLFLADGAAAPAHAPAAHGWLTPELAAFLGALLVSVVANVLQALGKKELAAKAEAAAPLVGSVAGAIAMVRREGKLDPISQAALLGALKQTSGALGVAKHLDAIAAGANAVPLVDGKVDTAAAARAGLEAASKVLAPAPAPGLVAGAVRRMTGKVALLLLALGLLAALAGCGPTDRERSDAAAVPSAWELIDGPPNFNGFGAKLGSDRVWRSRTPGGWLVLYRAERPCLVHIPDPGHAWSQAAPEAPR